MHYKYYKISIHLGPFVIVNNSKVYKIENGNSTIIPGLKYSLVTLLLGWWGFRFYNAFRESAKALSINFLGGEDITKLISEKEYDEDTNYVWNNLLRKTTEKINKKDLEIILCVQYEFAEKNSTELFKEPNLKYLLLALDKLQIYNVDQDVIMDFFDALEMYESKNSING